MYCKVKYFKPEYNGFAGAEYTYRTNLPVRCGDEVIAPTYKGEQRAVVTAVNVPFGEIDERWADKIREITAYASEKEETT